MARPAAITRSELASGLHALGVRPGAMLMVHTRMSALGWVVGASETVVRALLDAVGPQGTLRRVRARRAGDLPSLRVRRRLDAGAPRRLTAVTGRNARGVRP